MAVIFLVGCRPEGQGQVKAVEAQVRSPAVAGAFYPGSPDRLMSAIENFAGNVPEIEPAGKVLAVIAPHAGYNYSGQVAAYVHKSLIGVDIDTAVIIGHDAYRGAVAFLATPDYFQTPLGNVPVDKEMAAKMLAFHPGIRADNSIHARDHTIEVHLPFFKALNKQCKIVPVLFGNPTVENCRILADAISAAAGNKKTLVMASTDMSHYPPYQQAQELDNRTLESLRALDADKFLAHLKKEEASGAVSNLRTAMCASGGVGTAIIFAKRLGADHVQILRYANSGDVPIGDKNSVVGYGAALILKMTMKDNQEKN